MKTLTTLILILITSAGYGQSKKEKQLGRLYFVAYSTSSRTGNLIAICYGEPNNACLKDMVYIVTRGADTSHIVILSYQRITMGAATGFFTKKSHFLNISTEKNTYQYKP